MLLRVRREQATRRSSNPVVAVLHASSGPPRTSLACIQKSITHQQSSARLALSRLRKHMALSLNAPRPSCPRIVFTEAFAYNAPTGVSVRLGVRHRNEPTGKRGKDT